MMNDKLFNFKLSKIYPLLIAKALKKGRTEDEVLSLFSNLLGYKKEEVLKLVQTDITYGEFFEKAPCLNENRISFKGSICGVKIEKIDNPIERDMRILDKMVDNLAKGKSLEKILL